MEHHAKNVFMSKMLFLIWSTCTKKECKNIKELQSVLAHLCGIPKYITIESFIINKYIESNVVI